MLYANDKYHLAHALTRGGEAHYPCHHTICFSVFQSDKTIAKGIMKILIIYNELQSWPDYHIVDMKICLVFLFSLGWKQNKQQTNDHSFYLIVAICWTLKLDNIVVMALQVFSVRYAQFWKQGSFFKHFTHLTKHHTQFAERPCLFAKWISQNHKQNDKNLTLFSCHERIFQWLYTVSLP